MRMRCFIPVAMSFSMKAGGPVAFVAGPGPYCVSANNLGTNASANGATAFTDGELDALFHGDRLDQLHGHLDVVPRHDHLDAFWQFDGTGHIGRAHIEL